MKTQLLTLACTVAALTAGCDGATMRGNVDTEAGNVWVHGEDAFGATAKSGGGRVLVDARGAALFDKAGNVAWVGPDCMLRTAAPNSSEAESLLDSFQRLEADAKR